MGGKVPIFASSKPRVALTDGAGKQTLSGWCGPRIAEKHSAYERTTVPLWRNNFCQGVDALKATVAPGPPQATSDKAFRMVKPLLEKPFADVRTGRLAVGAPTSKRAREFGSIGRRCPRCSENCVTGDLGTGCRDVRPSGTRSRISFGRQPRRHHTEAGEIAPIRDGESEALT